MRRIRLRASLFIYGRIHVSTSAKVRQSSVSSAWFCVVKGASASQSSSIRRNAYEVRTKNGLMISEEMCVIRSSDVGSVVIFHPGDFFSAFLEITSGPFRNEREKEWVNEWIQLEIIELGKFLAESLYSVKSIESVMNSLNALTVLAPRYKTSLARCFTSGEIQLSMLQLFAAENMLFVSKSEIYCPCKIVRFFLLSMWPKYILNCHISIPNKWC